MRNDPPPLMIFAAGFGTRMRPLTDTRPKPLIEVAGRPLIDHAIGMARAAGITRIVVNAHYLADQVAAHFEDTDVTVVREDPDILDTGGGLRHALPQLGADTVLTLNSDAIWSGENPVAALLEAWDPARMDALLSCVPVEQTVGYDGPGDFTIGADGTLTRGPGVVYGGLQILRTECLHAVPDAVFSLNRVWDGMQADKRLFGLPHRGRWCDVGHAGGIALAEALLEGADV